MNMCSKPPNKTNKQTTKPTETEKQDSQARARMCKTKGDVISNTILQRNLCIPHMLRKNRILTNKPPIEKILTDGFQVLFVKDYFLKMIQ